MNDGHGRKGGFGRCGRGVLFGQENQSLLGEVPVLALLQLLFLPFRPPSSSSNFPPSGLPPVLADLGFNVTQSTSGQVQFSDSCVCGLTCKLCKAFP